MEFAVVRYLHSMRFHREAMTAIRECRHLSKSELAVAAQLSLSYISELEAGIKRTPSFEAIRAIAEVLEVTPKALYVIVPEPADLLRHEVA